MKKQESQIILIERFGCFARLRDGVLETSPESIDGINLNDWSEVQDFSEEFCKTVNKLFDTEFKANV